MFQKRLEHSFLLDIFRFKWKFPLCWPFKKYLPSLVVLVNSYAGSKEGAYLIFDKTQSRNENIYSSFVFIKILSCNVL